jgi:hypothetical protein
MMPVWLTCQGGRVLAAKVKVGGTLRTNKIEEYPNPWKAQRFQSTSFKLTLPVSRNAEFGYVIEE